MYQERFNKSKLLNHSLKIMRGDYDAVCVFDIDMIYCSDFFHRVETAMYRGCDYVVCYGQKLSEKRTWIIGEDLPSNEEIFRWEGEAFKGCSQIVFNQKILKLFRKCFGCFYDERYEGWGGEDSDLSYKSRLLSEVRGVIKKRQLDKAWCHMFHPSARPEDYRNTDKNSNRFQRSQGESAEKIQRYCNVS